MEQSVAARVALSAATYAIDKPYTYLVPPELRETLLPGMRVIVPFGAGNRRTEGIVLSIEALAAPDAKCKSVLTQLDEEPVLDGEGLHLAIWMRERYFCTVYDAARAMLPAGLYFSLQDRYRLAPGIGRERAYEAAGNSEYARTIVEMVCASGSAELGKIRTVFGTPKPRPRAQAAGGPWDPGARDQRLPGRWGQDRAGSRPGGPAGRTPWPRSPPGGGRPPMRYAVMELLCAIGEASTKELCYFTGASLETLRSLRKAD